MLLLGSSVVKLMADIRSYQDLVRRVSVESQVPRIFETTFKPNRDPPLADERIRHEAIIAIGGQQDVRLWRPIELAVLLEAYHCRLQHQDLYGSPADATVDDLKRVVLIAEEVLCRDASAIAKTNDLALAHFRVGVAQRALGHAADAPKDAINWHRRAMHSFQKSRSYAAFPATLNNMAMLILHGFVEAGSFEGFSLEEGLVLISQIENVVPTPLDQEPLYWEFVDTAMQVRLHMVRLEPGKAELRERAAETADRLVVALRNAKRMDAAARVSQLALFLRSGGLVPSAEDAAKLSDQ